MNTSLIYSNLWRFLGLVFFQVIVLREVSLSINENFNILVYPLFILFLPLQIFTPYAVLLGFAIGITVDLFYGNYGLHASAGAFSGFARNFLLKVFMPRGGFSGREIIPAPEYFGWTWFLQVCSLFLFLHIFWYYSVDDFSFVFIKSITLKTLVALALSMLFAIFYGFLFNPKQ